MSIWLHALAGGVTGLGASISANDQEKRAARGLKLRESYISKRQDKLIAAQAAGRQETQDFTAGENELSREASAEQARLTRAQQTELAGESREFQMEMAKFNSSEAMQHVEARIEAAASEGDKNRTAAAQRLKEQLEAAGMGAIRRNQSAAFERFYDDVQRRAKEFPAQDSEGNTVYNSTGDPMPDFDLEIEMIELYHAGGNVPDVGATTEDGRATLDVRRRSGERRCGRGCDKARGLYRAA